MLRRVASLHDLDGAKIKFPNLALMKISTWLKSRGWLVLLNPQVVLAENFASTVFTWTVKNRKDLHKYNVVGGSGISLSWCLPPDVESLRPDYKLYRMDWGLGFISRGCIRGCKFCIVPRKEGKIHQVCTLDEIINPESNRVVFMDNNFLGLQNHCEILQEIVDRKLIIDFNQGLDIRLMNDENVRLLSKIKFEPVVRIAFDDFKYKNKFLAGMKLLRKYRMVSRTQVLTLIGFNENLEEEIERWSILKESKLSVYFMLYRAPDGSYPPAPANYIRNKNLMSFLNNSRFRIPTSCRERTRKWLRGWLNPPLSFDD